MFVIALAASLGLTVPIRHLALRFGMVDKPGTAESAREPDSAPRRDRDLRVSSSRSCSHATAFPSADCRHRWPAPRCWRIVGFLDDGGLLHHQVKLFVGMPIAALFLIASGIRAQLFSQFFPGPIGSILDFCLTIVWVVGITASFSILDHMDGLCAGIAAVAAGFFTMSAMMNGQELVGPSAPPLSGASLGFLRWNFNPAKIFMGDGGAMFLGFLMATLGPESPARRQPISLNWLVPILILAVPIFDTTLVSISRARRGLLPFTSPGKDHTAHRLSNLGIGHRGAVLAMYAGRSFTERLLCLFRISRRAPRTPCGLLVLGALAAVLFLERVPYDRQVKLHKSTAAS